MRGTRERIRLIVINADSFISIVFLSAVLLLPIWSLCATGLLLLGALSWPKMLLLAGPLSVLCVVFVGWLHVRYRGVLLPSELRIERLGSSIVAIVFLIVWAVFNMQFPSEHVLVDRDPGIYTLGALHLVENDNLRITNENKLEGMSSSASWAVGQSRLDDKELYFQGTHLLPALVGLGGRAVGAEHVFKLNIIFGVTALLAIFLFALRLLRPFWALVAMFVMAASMPMLYFSRDMYTEPLAATFIFTGLLLMWLSVQTRDRLLWCMAGMAVGASTLTRIDGYLAIAGAMVFAAFYVVFGMKRERRRRIYESLLLAFGAAVTGFFGWLDIFFLSSGYFFDLYSNFILQILAIVAVVVFAVIVCRVHWNTAFISIISKKFSKKYPLLIAIGSVMTVVILATRQFWNQTYNPAGLRNFNEFAGLWPSWYFGDAIISLSVVGVFILLNLMLVKKKIIYLIPLSMVLLTAALYLVRPSIAPDQVWASRRLLPVVLPGLVVFSMIAVQAGVKLFNDKYLKSNIMAPNNLMITKALFTIGIAIMLIVPPLSVSRPMLLGAQYTQRQVMQDFCNKLPSNAAVVWIGSGADWAVRSTDVLCNRLSVGLKDTNISNENLLAISENARAKNFVPVLAVLGKDIYPTADQLALNEYRGVIPEADKHKFKTGATGVYSRLQPSLYGAPREMIETGFDIYYVELQQGMPLFGHSAN